MEVDETYIGGKERTSTTAREVALGVLLGKPQLWDKGQESEQGCGKACSESDKEEIQGFIGENVSPKAMVYTDDHKKLYWTSIRA